MTEVFYATREDVKSALDVQTSARSDKQVDLQIEAASRMIEADFLRCFYPSVTTQTFDWPDHQYSTPWRLWLEQRELISVTAVTAAGLDITASVLLRPDDAPMRGMPYTKIEIDLSTSAAFNSGRTFQRSISVAGTFGYCAAETAGGTISAFGDTTGTTGTVSDSSLVGVGNIIRVDQERMAVTGRAMAATGQTITTSPAAMNNVTGVGVSSGAAFDVGEPILIDSEKMLITDIAGNNLIVNRATDGTVLGAHTTGAAVYAPRLLTVERGVLGTTAATHAANAPVYVHQVPSLIRQLCIAQAVVNLIQTRAGYPAPMGRRPPRGATGDALPTQPSDLDDLWDRARKRYARLRTRTTARPV